MRVSMGVLLRKRRLFVALVGMALAVPGMAAQPVHAEDRSSASDPDAAARSAFEAGRQAYDHGAFGEAVTLFERAHALSPKPELLFNIGRAADADGQSAHAISLYSAYLDAFPAAENRDFVLARLEKMRALESLRSASAAPVAPLPTVAAAMPAETPEPVTTNFVAAKERDDDPPRPFWKRLWFWSVVGAVAVGGVTAGVIAATRQHDPERAAADSYVVTPELR
jgi:tetratricopeptide (TPR) repeat protein